MTFYTDFTTNGDHGICWTTTPYNSETIQQVPYIEMFGYQQDWSAMVAGINTWFTRFKNIGDENANPYENMYLGTEVHAYKLPYLQEYHHNISQSWQENTGPVGEATQELTKYVETAARAFLPAAGILYPKSYAGSQAASYTVSFNLINTYAGDGNGISDNVKKNKRFIEQFIMDNLHNQNGALSIVPPLIYEVYIPGIRWSPVAVVDGLTVNNKGTMNVNKDGIIISQPENYIYPDAWEVTFSIKELINESRKIWKDAISDYSSAGDGRIKTRTIKG
jgi:hypothetical protein